MLALPGKTVTTLVGGGGGGGGDGTLTLCLLQAEDAKSDANTIPTSEKRQTFLHFIIQPTPENERVCRKHGT